MFRAGVDPMQLHISITALSYFHVSNRYTLSAMFGRDLGAENFMAQRRAHAESLIMGWLAKPSANIRLQSQRTKKAANAR